MGATLQDNLIPIEQIPLGHAEVANWAALFFCLKIENTNQYCYKKIGPRIS